MKKYFFLILFSAGILFSTTTAYAAPCQFISEDNVGWGTGRIASFNINIVNNNGCPNGWGTTQGSVLLNDTPATITFWGQDGVSITVPTSVEGLANIKVIGNDGVTYGTSQLLISLKVDSHPSNITLGDSIEISGNFANTPGSEDINSDSWPGRVVNLTAGGYNQRLRLVSWTDTRIVISTSDTGYFKIGANTLKVYYGANGANPSSGFTSKTFDVNISAPLCTASSWSCSDWNTCSASGNQTRSCSKIGTCEGGISAPETSQSCTYVPPVCTSWTYSGWFECKADNTQTRNIISSFPNGCSGGKPTLTQGCSYSPPKPITPVIPPPVYQPPQPSCTTDTWSCSDWNSCSISGVQNRSCRKTFDCPSVETAPPNTDQYCESPNKPTQQVPQDSSALSNQDTIIKATVKLICPLDENKASQGSGTVIDSSGTILTNKHVVDGTVGCLVGFISDFNDEPYFGDRQIADIQKVSSGEDIAVLKLRNPQNKNLTYINVANGSNNLRLGTKVNIYGYPAKFGTNITYTSGDFSGTSGSYLKTTAIIEHGNSGGGAYLNDGTFMGMPSAVIKGELNALGYILSINTINAWLGNSSIAYNNSNQNNYSRVSSILEKIDLKKLNSLELVIIGTKETNSKATQNSSATSPSTIKKSTPGPIQKETSNIKVEPSIQNQNDKSVKSNLEVNQNNNQAPAPSVSQSRPSLAKRFVNWVVSWFK